MLVFESLGFENGSHCRVWGLSVKGLNSVKRVIQGIINGTTKGVTKGDTRRLDDSSSVVEFTQNLYKFRYRVCLYHISAIFFGFAGDLALGFCS